MCERDGFIPRYYIDKPKDKVDRVIQDMQNYTYELVTEELGLGNLIENAVRALEHERSTIQAVVDQGENGEDDQLFDYSKKELSDKDFQDFNDSMESLDGVDDD